MKELLERKAKVIAQMREIGQHAEARSLTAEETEAFERAKAELAEVTQRIKQLEATRALGDTATPAPVQGLDRAELPADAEMRGMLALNGWARSGLNQYGIQPHPLQAEAMRQAPGLGFGGAVVRLQNPQQRAMSAVIGASGGFTVGSTLVPTLERALLAYGGIRAAATVRRTATGEPLKLMTCKDTSNEGSIINENVDRSSGTDLSFGLLELGAFTYTSKVILVPFELLQDATFDIGAEIGSAAGERIGRAQAGHFATGTGVSQPMGITVAGTSGVTAASATEVTADELIELKFSVNSAYRAGAVWVMPDTSVYALSLLKDGDGQYIWRPGLVDGTPDTLLGHRIVVDDKMPAQTTGLKPIAFGQLGKYQVRDVMDVMLTRLVERYAEYGQVGFLAHMRSDGDLLDAGTHPIKYITMA